MYTNVYTHVLTHVKLLVYGWWIWSYHNNERVYGSVVLLGTMYYAQSVYM